MSVSAARRDHRSSSQYDVVNPIEHRVNLANAGTVHNGRLPHADEVVWREPLFQVRHGLPQQVTVAGGVYAGVVSRGFDPKHVGNGDKENPVLVLHQKQPCILRLHSLVLKVQRFKWSPMRVRIPWYMSGFM